jgi:Fur family ferric uptake transcriptional regulator
VIHDGDTLVPDQIRSELRARGLRWTPQRRAILEVLRGTEGHVTVIELIEQCRRRDPDVTPSTVYRTLETLEELGLVRHSHGVDGREEYHVRPETEHGHLACSSCGQSWELDAGEVRNFLRGLARTRAFEADLSHLTVVGRCRDCRAAT